MMIVSGDVVESLGFSGVVQENGRRGFGGVMGGVRH